MSGNVIVAGDPNLLAANIVKGKSIFGVTGTAVQYLSSPSSVLSGKTWGSGLTTGFSDNGAGIVQSSSSIYWFGGSSGTHYVRTNCAVNLEGWKYLKLVASFSKGANDQWTNARIGVSTSPNFTGYTAWSAKGTGTASDVTMISDITSLSGMYYIYIEAGITSWNNSIEVESITLANS